MTCFCDATTCQKTSCSALPGFCGIQSDGCGGSINCSSNCKGGETCDGTVCIPTCVAGQSGRSLCGNQCNTSVTDACGNITDCTCSGDKTCGSNDTCCTGTQECSASDCGEKTDDCGNTYNCAFGCPSEFNPCQSAIGDPINDWQPCTYGPLESPGSCDDGVCTAGT